MGEATPPLSIGSIVGGSTALNALWTDAVTRLTRRIAARRRGLETPLNLNVVFQIPGDLLGPDFTGARTGAFSKKEALLMVQVALPKTPPSDVDADLQRRLLAAVDQAEAWAQRRGIADNLDSLRKFASSL